MKEVLKILKEILPVLTTASLFSSFGGIGLQAIESKLIAIIPIAIALPAFADMLGDFSTIWCSRLCTFLFLGKRQIGELIVLAGKLAVVALLAVFYLLALICIFSAALFGFNVTFEIAIKLFLAMLAIVALVLGLIFVLGSFGGFFIYKFGGDPHNYLIPISISFCDFLGLIGLSLLVFAIF